jgi:muramoyltetrapeptide carboxypeptidase
MVPAAQPRRVRPPALRRGDTVGIIAPASGFRRDHFEAGCATLKRLGYEPFFLPAIFERELYLAGSAERRIAELHEMFARPEVKAILCARGGYGCNYLLPHLDLKLIRSNPKIFAGCSDVTSLLTYLSDAAEMVTFHAPMVAGDFARADGVDEESWLFAVSSKEGHEDQFSADDVQPLAKGTARGVLYGGCLSLLVASLGTPYEIRTEGAILFLEDRGEAPYRIDRMLMQLKLAGKFDGVKGFIFGEMIDCNPPAGQNYTLQEVIMRVVGDLSVPVAFGLRSGHVSRRCITLAIGVATTLTVGDGVSLHRDAAVRSGPARV